MTADEYRDTYSDQLNEAWMPDVPAPGSLEEKVAKLTETLGDTLELIKTMGGTNAQMLEVVGTQNKRIENLQRQIEVLASRPAAAVYGVPYTE